MKHSLTSGSIWKGLLFFAMPILLGNIFQQLYNTADAFIVGRFLDKNAYAAVSSSGSLIFLLVGFFNGIATGAGVVIARYYGAKEYDGLRTAVHTTLAFGLAAGIDANGSGRNGEFGLVFPDVFCRSDRDRHV